MTAKEKLTALADAIREASDTATPLSLDGMTALVRALGKGGLSTGITMGEFVTTDETKAGNIPIEHGLGEMPNFVFIWSTDTNYSNSCFRCVMTANLKEITDEETGEVGPESNFSLSIVDTTITFRNQSCNADYYDDKDVFWLPDANGKYYRPGTPHKWIAIRIED